MKGQKRRIATTEHREKQIGLDGAGGRADRQELPLEEGGIGIGFFVTADFKGL
jgi:hypothetical protein